MGNKNIWSALLQIYLDMKLLAFSFLKQKKKRKGPQERGWNTFWTSYCFPFIFLVTILWLISLTSFFCFLLNIPITHFTHLLYILWTSASILNLSRCLNHSCLENSRTVQPGRLPSMGSQRVGHNWVTDTHTHTNTHSVITTPGYTTIISDLITTTLPIRFPVLPSPIPIQWDGGDLCKIHDIMSVFGHPSDFLHYLQETSLTPHSHEFTLVWPAISLATHYSLTGLTVY